MTHYQRITIVEPLTGEPVEHILLRLPDGGVQSFANVESNKSGERATFLAWMAEGNTPEQVPG